MESPGGPMCFRCLIFRLSGPCELLFLYHWMFCVTLSMDRFVLWVKCLIVLVNCLVKQFAICLGVVAINIMVF